jgi:hypothetical protein
MDLGPGRPSIDAALAPRLRGSGWAVASLAAAAAGSWLATERFNEPEQPSFEREPRFQREETPVGAV